MSVMLRRARKYKLKYERREVGLTVKMPMTRGMATVTRMMMEKDLVRGPQ